MLSVLGRFLVCELPMSYRSSLSFVSLIFAKIKGLQLWTLLKFTVIQTFFLYNFRFSAEFWYARLPSCLCPRVIEIADFSTFWEGAIRVALTHLVLSVSQGSYNNLLFKQSFCRDFSTWNEPMYWNTFA